MFENNVHVKLGSDKNRKYAEIYCTDNNEMITLDTDQYVEGTKCMSVTNNQKEYRLSASKGKWYDSAGASVAGYNSDLGNITKTLTQATATGDGKAYYGNAVNIVLVPDQYYDLPATIVVTVGGVTKTVNTDYTYNTTTGAVYIKPATVTGAIVVTAVCAAENYGGITTTLSNITATGDDTAVYGEDIDITLAAAENYDLPTTIEVTIGGVAAVVDTGYTYDSTTGAVHIAGANVIGAVVVTATGTPESQGDITFTLTNLTSTGDDEAFYGEDVDVTLIAADGYTLPETITLTIGGVEKTVDTDYTYDAETGAIHIEGEKVLGAVVIVADGVESGA